MSDGISDSRRYGPLGGLGGLTPVRDAGGRDAFIFTEGTEPMADASDLLDDIVGQLANFATETGKSLATEASDLAVYTAERAQHLAGIYGEAGFREAVIAERDNVALRAGIAAAAEGDATDQRFLGLVDGILSTASGALVKFATGGLA